MGGIYVHIVRYYTPDQGVRIGALRDGRVVDLTAKLGAADWCELLARYGDALYARVEQAVTTAGGGDLAYDAVAVRPDPARPHLLAPVAPLEVWGSGVTYERSRDAREHETQVASIYDRVYTAERPELFLKATGPRIVGPYAPVGIRADSSWQVPEPEVGLWLDAQGRLMGVTIGNDMSARDIEGANPLYLPQAKIYRNACALGPSILLLAGAPPVFSIECSIERRGQTVFHGATSTSQMRRSFDELIGYLLRENWIAPGTVLLTGTGIVPPDEISLQEGDRIRITVEGIGVLENVALPTSQIQ